MGDKTFTTLWTEEEIAGINCTCGRELIVHFDEKFDECDCGRRYHFVPGYVVEVVEGMSGGWRPMELVSVNDDLPEVGKEVLCYYTFGKFEYYTVGRIDKYGIWSDEENYGIHPTHWCPLPKGPK